jgi:S1-C subfamily serine protease
VKRNATIPVITFLCAVIGLSAGLSRGAAGASLGSDAASAVLVTALTPSLRGTGAGTIVTIAGPEIRIVTAKHVAVFGKLSVQFACGSPVRATILSLVPGHDVAVLEAFVPLDVAGQLRAAALGIARPNEKVHVQGSGFDAQAFETASVTELGGELPDGPANGRYELACTLCHPGDSGAGVLDESGALVGVYVGYFTYDTGARVGVAEIPKEAVRVAVTVPYNDDRSIVALSANR